MPITAEIIPPSAVRAPAVASTLADLVAVERRLDTFARVMDSAVGIPGTRLRFGADSVIGLVPGIGDAATLCLSAYLVYEAQKIGVPDRILRKMLANIAVDAAIGAVPLLGDVADVFFKANLKNMALIRQHIAALKAEHAAPVAVSRTDGAARTVTR
ncbi:DUF4112 domain-containing protein [Chthonobacter rhizosphaerae]|uniref:DUF4112 domain-containing protein n=1 Tax=Chthonobacter rhizosphaerae TaxID=2735553 RepID=UPI001AEE5E9D|nr:DUF4112 domain-containing protein [Chthonobacter rhizosphaerae]